MTAYLSLLSSLYQSIPDAYAKCQGKFLACYEDVKSAMFCLKRMYAISMKDASWKREAAHSSLNAGNLLYPMECAAYLLSSQEYVCSCY